LDQRRPGNPGAGAEMIAPVDHGGDRLAGAAEIGRTFARRRRRAGDCHTREGELRPLAYAAEPDVDHLHRLLRRMMRVAVLVELIERGADRLAFTALELREIDRHRPRELLIDLTQVEIHLVLASIAEA